MEPFVDLRQRLNSLLRKSRDLPRQRPLPTPFAPLGAVMDATTGIDRLRTILVVSLMDERIYQRLISDGRLGWRARWLKSIQEFADYATQRRMWLDITNTNPHWSPIEYLEGHFHDSALSRAMEEGYLGLDEASLLEDFQSLVAAYDHQNLYDYEAVLEDPRWLEVVAAACRAQTNLLELLTDPIERYVLMTSSI